MIRLICRVIGAAQSQIHRNTMRQTGVVLVVILACGEPAQAAKFLGLADLPGGGSPFSDARGVSADGSVIVGLGISTSGYEAFRWTSGGGMDGLGDLTDGAFFSAASGVSVDGSVVVGGGTSAAGEEAFRWTSGGMVGLGDLANGPFSSNANGISSDGLVVVGRGESASGNEAFRWTSGGGMVGLGDLAGGAFQSTAQSVSADGSVVVGQCSPAVGREAFRWTNSGGMVGLGDLADGSFSSFAAAVSADGSVVVGFGHSASGQEAFRWTSSGGMVGLGDLPGGPFFESSATGVSADGAVVVGHSSTASGTEAFVWDDTNGMRSLKDVISPSVGAAINGWTLQNANAISADGRTVVGKGLDPSGNAQAWLAYLPDQVFWLPKTNGAWDAAANWSGPFGVEPGDSVMIEPAGSLTVLGPTTSATVAQLVIGGGTGIATLELQSGGTINSPTVAIDYTGVLTGDGTINGSVVSQGTVRADNVTITGTLINLQDSVVEGDGRVNVALDNGSLGLVRARAGEHLRLIGTSHINHGRIEAIGTPNELAEIEFRGTLANTDPTGLITGRHAVMRFNNGLTNKGSLAVTGGANDVFGDIDNMGAIVISGGAAATFYDDVDQGGTLRVSKVGSTTSTAVFLGDVTGGGGSTGGGDIFFEGDLRPGNSPAQVTYDNNVFLGSGSTLEIELGGMMPGLEHDKIIVEGSIALDGMLKVSLINSFMPQAGNSFDILDWDNLTGTFDTLALPVLTGSIVWNTDQFYATGVLAVVAPGLPGDYNQNGTVDAADYVVWRKNDGTQEGYNVWRANFGRTIGSGATAGPANSAAVPEPCALVLFSIGLASLLIRSSSDSLFGRR